MQEAEVRHRRLSLLLQIFLCLGSRLNFCKYKEIQQIELFIHLLWFFTWKGALIQHSLALVQYSLFIFFAPNIAIIAIRLHIASYNFSFQEVRFVKLLIIILF